MEEGTQVLCYLINNRVICANQGKDQGCLLCIFTVLMDVSALLHVKGERGTVSTAHVLQDTYVFFRFEQLHLSDRIIQSNIYSCLCHRSTSSNSQ